jgi:elongation factor Ts
MAITAKDVSELRKKTGAGMMDCKKVLAETNGDFEESAKLLKERGLAVAAKKAERITAEGLVDIIYCEECKTAAIIEVNAETDFVAKNPDFIALGEAIAARALEKGYSEPNEELNGMVTDLATKIRENMGLKRLKLLNAGSDECITQYIHGEASIGVVVKCKSDKPEIFKDEEVKSFIFSLALHIAAFNPYALDRSMIDSAYISEQKEIFRKLMEQDEKLQGKPANVLDGILEGKINKHLSEICLVDQGYVKDEKLTVAQAIAECSKKIGAKLEVAEYAYVKVGVGL